MLFLLLSSFDVRMAASDIISSPGNQISVNCCHGNLLIFYLNYPSPSWLEIKLAGEEAMKNARRPPNVINNSIKTDSMSRDKPKTILHVFEMVFGDTEFES